jgi:hypothetical protein
MFYALSVLVLASPVLLAVLLTSKMSRRAKTLVVLAYAVLLIVVPITAVALGAGAGT